MEDIGKLVLRLTTAGLILFHGISKIIHGVGFIEEQLVALHLPAIAAYGVFVGEVIAPAFLAIGLWTRVAALAIAFNLVVAISLDAYRFAFVIQRTGAWGLEAEAFFFLTALVVFLIGPGRYRIRTSSQGSRPAP
jgi:putative oxidoreductase